MIHTFSFSSSETIHRGLPVHFGNSGYRRILRKSNPFIRETRVELRKYLLSEEFQPLQQVATILIVAGTRKVIFEPVFTAMRFVRDVSGLGALGKKVKKWAEKKGEKRVENILPSIKLEPEIPV